MRASTLPLSFAAAALSLSSVSLARAADTPQQTYEHAVDCTSHVLALRASAVRQGGKPAADAPKLDNAVTRMRGEAIAAGAVVSIPADRVSLRIDQGRDRLVKALDQRDPAKLKQANQEIGLTAVSCLLDEAKKAIAERKDKAAAPAAR